MVDTAPSSTSRPVPAADEHVAYFPEVIFKTASRALGTPYTRGGSNLNGFDCSGFVQWTYKHVGISLPRTAREQASFGTPVPRDQMQVGDIVAFRHPRRGYHTGIYVGNNMFIHSPRQRQRVRYTSLDDVYFSRTFLGARRVLPPVDAARLAQIPVPSRTVALADRTKAPGVSLKAAGSKRRISSSASRSAQSISVGRAPKTTSAKVVFAKSTKNYGPVAKKRNKTTQISSKNPGRSSKSKAVTAQTPY